MTESNSFSITDGVNPPASASESASVNSQNEGSTMSGSDVNRSGKDVNPPPVQRLMDAALDMHNAGINVVPVKQDGSKRPDLPSWTKYQRQRTDGGQLFSWFASDQLTGIGCIYGAISGNAEMLEFEGRAVDEGILDEVTDLMENSGFGSVWEAITTGWAGRSPSGGYHFRFRVDGAPVKGNTKLASREAEEHELTDDERELKQRKPDKVILRPLIETRGEGGFGVCEPSHGKVHPSGRPYVRISGGPDTMPVIDVETYEAIHDICRAADRAPKQEAPQWRGRPMKELPEGQLRPGDDYNQRGDVPDLLRAHGWTFTHQRGVTQYWCRPGKQRGISASFNYRDCGKLYVFTSSTEFDNEKAYSPFAAYAILEHGGKFSDAARALGTQGYGTPLPEPGSRTVPDLTAYDKWVTEKTDDHGHVTTREAPRPPTVADLNTGQVTEQQFENRNAFIARIKSITDPASLKNEARKRVKELARKGTTEEERQEERDFLKEIAKLSAGDFKALYASAVRAGAHSDPDGSDGRPVYAMGDELKDYSNLVELIDTGVFPETYVRDGKLVHVQPVSGVRAAKGKISTSTYQAKDITAATLRRLVATYTMPYRVTEKGADSPLPTRAVCESVLDNPEWDGVDTLQGLTDAPFVRADGTICQDHGYDRPTGMWLALPPGYRPVPETPTAEDVSSAMNLIMNQVLKDFPFATTADRANAIGMLLTPMIRAITDCAVPLHLINAHTPGTGKTLLAKIAIAAHGGDAYTFPRNSDEELRKQVTSILMDQASPVVNFDNIASGSTLESPALAALITSSVWRDRLLGGNTTVALPNDKLWCATGNNIKLNTDIGQRSILVHLDAGTERPDLRPAEDFELGDLEQWLLHDRNRAELVRALLILIRDWAVAGMPRGPQTMRSFTPWAQAVGGLLAHHGISDFMSNTDSVVEADEDKQQDALFLQKWTELVTQEQISASDLITQFETMEQQRWTMAGGKGPDRWQGSFPVRSNGKPYSAIGLGKWLSARKDTPIHGFALRRRIDPDTNRSLWRVERVGTDSAAIGEQAEVFQPDLS